MILLLARFFILIFFQFLQHQEFAQNFQKLAKLIKFTVLRKIPKNSHFLLLKIK
jgi:hypothetical protein